MERELVDEDPAAGAAHRGRAIACSRRTDADCFSATSVGRLEVADGPLARPLGGQHQRAHERGLEVRGRPCDDGVGPALEPRAAGPVERRPSLRLDLDLALRAGSGCPARGGCGGVRCRRAGSRPGRTARPRRRTGRAARSARSARPRRRTRRGRAARRAQARRPGPPRSARPRRPGRRRRGCRRSSGRRSRSGRARASMHVPQWKYCPPSMTIVCPVTNDEVGPAR